ncbi:MAG TPA: hypothetical protein VF169_23720 [Albitalea sp.]|uniref:hypothetical protein n=1 Tax=Piscinibacter sp. TaxID=1903157 RepID=UPI002ED602CA
MFRRCAISLALSTGLIASVSHGADQDAALTELELKAKIAEAQARIAEAEAAAAKARLGSIESTLPKGSGTATDLKVEGAIMAYRTVDAVAARIASVLTQPRLNVTQVVLFSDKQLNGVLKYRAFIRQAELLEAAINVVTGGDPDNPQLPPLESASGTCKPKDQALAVARLSPLDAVDAALQLLSLAKTDKVLVGNEVKFEEFALAAAVIEKLHAIKPDLRIAYPPSFQPGLFTGRADPLQGSAVFVAFTSLMKRDVALAELLKLIARPLDELKERVKTARGDDCKAMFERDIARLEGREVKAKALQTVLSQMQAGLLKVDDASGASTLQSLYVAEVLATRFSDAHVLQITPVLAGGATMAKTNIFTTRFFFSGGAIASYMLFRGDTGEVVASGTVRGYSGFAKEGTLDDSGESN